MARLDPRWLLPLAVIGLAGCWWAYDFEEPAPLTDGGAQDGGVDAGAAVLPNPVVETVSAGVVCKGSKHVMVLSVGQSGPLQDVASSPKHHIQGGLIGVTEISLP